MRHTKQPIVIKFGGTSVSAKRCIKTITAVVKRELPRSPVVIVSAVSGVTDLLLSLQHCTNREKKAVIETIKKKHKKLIAQLVVPAAQRQTMGRYVDQTLQRLQEIHFPKPWSKASVDTVLSFGEILSSSIITHALIRNGINAEQVIATNLIVTDMNYGSAECLIDETETAVVKKLIPLLQNDIVPVVTGFIGATKSGKTTTLGRGGSDYSAAIIGFCLSACEIQIWTDVDGIYTADPRIVKQAKRIPTISYNEASEMAFFGAKVLHPRTIRPAIKAAIPVHVLNTMHPDHPGTLITSKPNYKKPITAVSSKQNITLITMYSTDMLHQKGFLARIFNTFAKHTISVDLVSVSEVSVSVTLDDTHNLSQALQQLEEFTATTVSRNNAIVSVIGEGITNSSQTIQELFSLLHKKQILVKMISLGATNINVSFVIESEKLNEAVKVLHNKLLLKRMGEPV